MRGTFRWNLAPKSLRDFFYFLLRWSCCHPQYIKNMDRMLPLASDYTIMTNTESLFFVPAPTYRLAADRLDISQLIAAPFYFLT